MTRQARNEKTIPNQELVLDAAKKLRDSGLSYEKIAKRLQAGVSAEWFRRRIEPGHAERARERGREITATIRHRLSKAFREPRPITDGELRRIRNAQPDDTRTLTGILMGDPLPGRSALDRKRQMERRT